MDGAKNRGYGPPFVWAVRISSAIALLSIGLLFLYPESKGYFLWMALLVPPAAEDGRTGYISDVWSFLIGLSALAEGWMTGMPALGIWSAMGTAGFFGALYILSRGGMGSGDGVLATAVALRLSPVWAMFFLWCAAVSALAFACLIKVRRGYWLREIRFGPFLSLGGGAAYVGQAVVGEYCYEAIGLFAF